MNLSLKNTAKATGWVAFAAMAVAVVGIGVAGIKPVHAAPSPSPVLSSPPNESATNNTEPTFEWNAFTGADEYEFLLLDNSENTVVDQTGITGTSWTLLAPLAEGSYAWMVRAQYNAAPPSNYSNAFTFTVDTTHPTVSTDKIYFSGCTGGTDSICKVGDTVTVNWLNNTDTGDGNTDIAAASVNLSSIGGLPDATLIADENGDYHSMVPFTLTAGTLNDDYDFTITANDHAGNATTSGTFSFAFDTVLPTFAATNPVQALKQDGSAPAHSANTWYYYTHDGPADTLRLKVTTGEAGDTVKVCLRALQFNDQTESGLCSTGDFVGGEIYADGSAEDGHPTVYDVNASFVYPEGIGGYPLNIQITDSSGNSVTSSTNAQFFVPVIGINPINFDESLANEGTTDWSTISDFTAVPELSFYAQDSGNELGDITFSSPVNLTDSAIIQGLVNFGQNILVTGQKMRINSSALAALNAAATISMSTGITSDTQPPLAVRDNNGNLLGTVPEGQEGGLTIGPDTLGNFSWNGETSMLSFTTTGFSEFDALVKTAMDSENKTATVTAGNDAEVDVPSGVTDGKVDVSSMITGTTGTLPAINISSDTSVGHVDVQIPSGVTVTGDPGWDGTINTPSVKSVDSVTVTGVSGATTVSSVLEIGSNDTAITFDKGVRILLHGQAGKLVGFSRSGVFTQITATCSADSQAVGDALDPGADCKRDVGSDLVVWTKHFTSFVTFTMAGGTGGGGGGGGSMPAATISVRTPVAGATYKAGAVVGVEWSAQNGAFVNYKISYSADNGATWTTVADKLTGSPSYLWTVSAISTTTGQVKVDGYDSYGNLLASAVSGTFTVNGVPGSIVAAPSATDDNVTGNYDPKNAADNTPDINTDKGLTAPPAGTTVYCTAGTLIKGSLPSVYYCGRDGKRYVFVNDKAFFTWYVDFKGVTTISDTDLAKIPLGGNITYRPGKRMIKVQSDPKVYVVARNGTLRWVSTEAMAVKLFGANWNKMIDDVSDAFFVNYKMGSQL